MQHKKITGIILGIKPYQEMDRLLSVFSLEYGCLSIMAKGVKKITSQRGFHLDILNIVKMELEETGISGYSKFYLREIEITNSLKNAKMSSSSFAACCVIASFLKRTLPERSPQKTIFGITQKTLESLDKGKEPSGVLLQYFLKTMRIMGYLPKTLPKETLRTALWKTLTQLDPEFTLTTRRTFGIFSKLDTKRSN